MTALIVCFGNGDRTIPGYEWNDSHPLLGLLLVLWLSERNVYEYNW